MIRAMTKTEETSPSAVGTRPEGSRDECEAAAHVQAMFGEIAPRYDFLNHVLSFWLDHLWRRRTAKRFQHIVDRPEAPAFWTFAAARATSPSRSIARANWRCADSRVQYAAHRWE